MRRLYGGLIFLLVLVLSVLFRPPTVWEKDQSINVNHATLSAVLTGERSQIEVSSTSFASSHDLRLLTATGAAIHSVTSTAIEHRGGTQRNGASTSGARQPRAGTAAYLLLNHHRATDRGNRQRSTLLTV